MKIAQLRDVLEKFARLHAANGAGETSSALRKFSKALQQHDNKTVKSFVKTTRARTSK